MIEDALFCMKEIAGIETCENCQNYDRCDNTLIEENARYAIYALEKQIQKKPVIKRNVYGDISVCPIRTKTGGRKMLEKEKIIDMATVVKYGTLPQRGRIRTRERSGKDEVVIETGGIGFAVTVPVLLDFLKEARII